MGRTGLEPDDVGDCSEEDLEPGGERGAAESGALGPDFRHFGPDLQAVIDAWADLPEAVKAGILAMVKATMKE